MAQKAIDVAGIKFETAKTYAIALIEVGKQDLDSQKIDEGISLLMLAEQFLVLEPHQNTDTMTELRRMIKLASKIKALKEINQYKTRESTFYSIHLLLTSLEQLKIMKKHCSILKKLRVVLKNKVTMPENQSNLGQI